MSEPKRPLDDLQMRVLRDACTPEDDSEDARARATLWSFAFRQIDYLDARIAELEAEVERLTALLRELQPWQLAAHAHMIDVALGEVQDE